MRSDALIAVATLLFGTAVHAQTLTEYGAAAATGTVGGVSGKKGSEGVSAIFGKVDKQAASAAASATDGKKPSAGSSKGALSEGAPGRPTANATATSGTAASTKPAP